MIYDEDFKKLLTFRKCWFQLARVLAHVIESQKNGKRFDIRTARKISGMQWQDSPCVDINVLEDHRIRVELSGNLLLQPQLDASQEYMMMRLNWELPTVSPSKFTSENHFGGVPNFCKVFPADRAAVEIGREIVAALVNCYSMSELDGFTFTTDLEMVAEIEALGQMQLLPYTNKRGEKLAFALKDPGKPKDSSYYYSHELDELIFDDDYDWQE